MPVVAPNQGLRSLLTYLLISDNEPVPSWVFSLFVNDIQPDQDTIFIEVDRATFTGFTELTMSRQNWTTPVIADDHAVSTWKSTPSAWTCTANPQTVYGWCAFNFTTQVLTLIERFDTPRVLHVGDTISVLPRITLTTEQLL